MQIEDEQPSTLSLSEILSDPQQKIKIVRILHRALSSMGFKESAQQLEKESQIYPQEETESKLKNLLQHKQYPEVNALIQTLDLVPQIKRQVFLILTQLTILQLIQQKNYELAIEMVTNCWPNDEGNQIKFLSMLATDQPISSDEFFSRQNSILQKCTNDSFELKNNIEKLLQGYLSTPLPHKISKKEEQPFRKIIAESEKITVSGKCTHLKLNPKGTLICLISESQKQMQASIWMIHGPKINVGLHWRQQNVGRVNSLCWDQLGQRISICTYTKLTILHAINFLQKIVIDSKALLGGKFLCCRWNSNLIYVGGLADSITAADVNGNPVRTIQPFMRTRDIVFGANNDLYGISATKSLLIRFSLHQQKILASFESKSCFMDLHIDQKSQTVVVTNQQSIFLLNQMTLIPITTINSPLNQKMYKIEAFFANSWLLIYNEKLSAIFQSNQIARHHSWPDCDAVDIRGHLMVTVRSTLKLWMSEIVNEEHSDVSMQRVGTDNFEDVEWYSQSLQEQQGEEFQMRSIQSHSNQQQSVAQHSESSDIVGSLNPFEAEAAQAQQNEVESDPQSLNQQ